MPKLQTLIFLCSTVCAMSTFAQDNISETLKKDQQVTQELQQEIQKKRQENNADKSTLVMWDNIEAVLEAKSQCFKKDEDIEMHLCISEAIKKLADEGNFAAQDSVAQTYMAKPHENYEMALSWFKKALENPKTSVEYKQFIVENIKKIETLIETNNTEEKSTSQQLKEDMAAIINEQKNIEKEIKKAERVRDKESLEMLTELDMVFNSQKPCFDLKEELDIQVCMLRQIKNLADKNNFFAQHQLGNIYENSIENKAMAIKWYSAALKNPKTPNSYKPEIQSDLDRVKSKTVDTPEKKKQPLKP